MSKRTKIEDEQSDPAIDTRECTKCYKPLSDSGCGIDGKGLSYCMPEGESMSDSQKARLAEQQANVRR